jgi:hypothetical protein
MKKIAITLFVLLALIISGCVYFPKGEQRVAEIQGNEYYPKMQCYFEPYGIFDIKSEKLNEQELSLTIRSWLDKDIDIQINKLQSGFSDWKLSNNTLKKNGTVVLTFSNNKLVDSKEYFFKQITLTSDQTIWFNGFGTPINYIELRCSNQSSMEKQ